ncbi:acyl-CoA thioesterase [Aestuariivirga sp.]|uniref:acyl-CoA thioesterase n=1 Tax=Aestuariivirga sp. TaxID=2650926 RepID=UPI003BABE342
MEENDAAQSLRGLITFVGVAHPWMCDAMGHVNVRSYAAMFDDASFQLLGRVAGIAAEEGSHLGWADVRCEVAYRREIRAGDLLTIHSRVEKIGNSSLAYSHRLIGSIDGAVRADAKIVTVRFDTGARRKMELEDHIRLRVEALMRRQASALAE